MKFRSFAELSLYIYWLFLVNLECPNLRLVSETFLNIKSKLCYLTNKY